MGTYKSLVYVGVIGPLWCSMNVPSSLVHSLFPKLWHSLSYIHSSKCVPCTISLPIFQACGRTLFPLLSASFDFQPKLVHECMLTLVQQSWVINTALIDVLHTP